MPIKLKNYHKKQLNLHLAPYIFRIFLDTHLHETKLPEKMFSEFGCVCSFKTSKVCHTMVYGNIYLRKQWQTFLFFKKKTWKTWWLYHVLLRFFLRRFCYILRKTFSERVCLKAYLLYRYSFFQGIAAILRNRRQLGFSEGESLIISYVTREYGMVLLRFVKSSYFFSNWRLLVRILLNMS